MFIEKSLMELAIRITDKRERERQVSSLLHITKLYGDDLSIDLTRWVRLTSSPLHR